jgi:hypothetical protein
MRRTARNIIRGLVFCALIFVAASFSQAGTIIKLNLADVGPDIGMNGAGILSTINDGNAATTGDQDTAVEFTGFLNFIPDIVPNIASFSMHNLAEVGPANVFGTLVIQNFFGGTIELYDPANTLLLSGQLNNSALSGVIGPPGTGALFTTTFSQVTGGTLAPLIVPNSLSLSMNMTNVNGGNGFAVAGGGPALNPFLADAAVNIAADPVPEPATLMLVLMGSAAAVACSRRSRR